jgi:hypothetical protein
MPTGAISAPGHQVAIEHRWRQRPCFASAAHRDATSQVPIRHGCRSARNACIQLYFAQFASIEPDPVLPRCRWFVPCCSAFGLDPNAVVAGGALTSAVTSSASRRSSRWFTPVGQRTSRSTVLGFRNSVPARSLTTRPGLADSTEALADPAWFERASLNAPLDAAATRLNVSRL